MHCAQDRNCPTCNSPSRINGSLFSFVCKLAETSKQNIKKKPFGLYLLTRVLSPPEDARLLNLANMMREDPAQARLQVRQMTSTTSNITFCQFNFLPSPFFTSTDSTHNLGSRAGIHCLLAYAHVYTALGQRKRCCSQSGILRGRAQTETRCRPPFIR